jgi:hypothetical protein
VINDPEPLASGRAAAASGISFSVLFIAGLLPLGELLGSFADSDQTFEAYFADSANRAGNIVGGILLVAAALVFLWFIQHLRQRLQSDTTRPPTLPNFVYSTGQTFVTLLLVGTAALVTVPVTLAFATLFDDQPFTTGQAVLPQLGTVIVAFFANWTAAAMVLTATIAARRTGSFPRWLRGLGYAVPTFMVLFTLTIGLSFLALALWTLAVSIHWWRTT